MNKLLPKLATTAAVASVLASNPMLANAEIQGSFAPRAQPPARGSRSRGQPEIDRMAVRPMIHGPMMTVDECRLKNMCLAPASRAEVAMGWNVAQKLIRSHLAEGEMLPGREIGIRIDQTLTQDATGTLVMLELEAMGLDRVRTEISAQYVDHNLVQEDFKNPDDHLFLRSACRRFGIWYSPAGNGVSHPVHQERFGKPGKTLLGSDSHTPAAGDSAHRPLAAARPQPYWLRSGRSSHPDAGAAASLPAQRWSDAA